MLGDVVVLQYGPGIEVEARVIAEPDGPHLSWIGYASHRADDLPAPTITAAALEALRTGGDRDGPIDPAVGGALPLDPTPESHAQYAWIRLCLDATGQIASAHVAETTSPQASTAFLATAKAWTFRPFATAKAIAKSPRRGATGTFRICLDEAGAVTSVLPIRSTGFGAYDAERMTAMRQWRYAPYEVDGAPVPVQYNQN
jgi:hypothetical protein